jgi:hypothetical protein
VQKKYQPTNLSSNDASISRAAGQVIMAARAANQTVMTEQKQHGSMLQVLWSAVTGLASRLIMGTTSIASCALLAVTGWRRQFLNRGQGGGQWFICY